MTVATQTQPKKVSIHSHQHYLQSKAETLTMMRCKFPYLETEGDQRFLIIDNGMQKDRRPVREELVSPQAMIAKMKEQGITHRLQWISPWIFNYRRSYEETLWFTQLHNNKLMEEWVNPYPQYFSGACALPMQQFSSLAIKEARRCYAMGYRAVTIGTSVAGVELDNERFDELWKTLSDLNMVVCVHPDEMTGSDAYWRQWRIGMPNVTASAMDAFTFGGILQKFPDLKVLFSHGGVSWLANFGRSLHAFKCRPQKFVGCPNPETFLKQINVDTHTSDIDMLQLFIKKFGSDMFLYGDDAPFPLGDYPNNTTDYIVNPGETIMSASFGPNDAEIKEKLFYKNAERFLGRTF